MNSKKNLTASVPAAAFDSAVPHQFPFRWKIKNGYPAAGIEHHGKTVFSCFACGGGSTMGYKLAGYDVIGANDIDPRMAKVYKANHHPKHYFLCDIRSLNDKIKSGEMPPELYNLDVLDGSPPCSTFSLTGSREKAWGKKKKFAEGQAAQVLDDLFFYFIETAHLLQPRIVIAENVAGMLAGNARGYVLAIFEKFDDAGYYTQLFRLNGASMGLPQRRERIFFLCRRKNIDLPEIKLDFCEPSISVDEAEKLNTRQDVFENITPREVRYWHMARRGDPVGKYSTIRKIKKFQPMNTITASNSLFHHSEIRRVSRNENIICGSFPVDYQFGTVEARYLIGMSVPPVMMAQISHQVYLQWLSHENKKAAGI